MWLLWVKVVRRPIDSLAIFAASAASLVIIVNAVALQSGARPAPFVANTPASPPPDDAAHPKLAEAPSPPLPAAAPRMAEGPAVRSDPIAEFIGTSSRVVAVQRVLANYGYGQIKPSGVLDQPTRLAIAKFEREHRLPVTGRISHRLMSELSAMVGHSLD
jgi:peptidoglycan hydrolase-like protein with peptidoglycan-binding domain